MGRLDATPEPQSSDQTPFQPPPQQAYPTHAPPPPPPQGYPHDAPPPPQPQGHPNDAPPPPQPPQGYPNDESPPPKPQQQGYPTHAPPSPQPQGYPTHSPPTPQPQGYPTHAPPPPPPPQAAYIPNNDHNTNHLQSSRSYIPQPAEQPPPESYPPQKPAPYPPQQSPAAYPPHQSPVGYPPPSPVAYPPQPEPVAFPPQPTVNATSYAPQSYNYVHNNQSPAVYHTPVKDGIAVGSQYLAPTQGWRTGLFDFAEDPENAIMTACFPCVTFGQIAEIVDNGQTSCATSGLLYGLISAIIYIPCIMSCSYRTKIRSRFGLMETPAPDWVTHFFCEWCALCQEYRELKARGWDPAIGWQGNVTRNQQMQYSAMAPPANQTMMG